MKIIMDDSRLTNVTELQTFLKASQKVVVSLESATIEKKYTRIDKAIDQFHYHTLKKKR